MSILTEFDLPFLKIAGDVFIDTGCGYGDSLLKATAQPFSELHGIDVSSANIARCRSRFGANDRVQLHLGTSPDVLPTILDPARKMVIFCDAHYQGNENWDEYDPKYGQCPLLHELRAILQQDWKTQPIILIDDASIFLEGSGWWERYCPRSYIRSHWPTFEEIEELLRDNYQLKIRREIIYAYEGDD